MNTNRDTQFKGFAEAVVLEMLTLRQGDWIDFNVADTEEIEEYSAIIARRAYDLVAHACETVDDKESQEESRITSDYMLSIIPDMPELPKEQE